MRELQLGTLEDLKEQRIELTSGLTLLEGAEETERVVDSPLFSLFAPVGWFSLAARGGLFRAVWNDRAIEVARSLPRWYAGGWCQRTAMSGSAPAAKKPEPTDARRALERFVGDGQSTPRAS